MASKNNSPLARMREQFKDKESLVDRLLEVIDKGDQEKDKLKERLLAASNRKLLRLFEATSEIKSKWGGADKLAAAVAQVSGKAKDADYISRIAKLTPARLLDLFRAAERRAKRQQSSAT